MEKSFGLFFHLKTTKNYKGVGELPIYLCVTVDKVSREISTKRKWDPAKWNSDSGRAEGKTDIVRSLNSYLDLLQRKVYEARQQLLHHGHPVTAENVKTVFYGKEIKTHKYMLMEVFKKHNDQMAELVGLEYAPGTLERFQTAYRHTLTFLKANRIFELIAKEGRKFGMLLIISSQRPSELSQTVLSQCSNFIVHRIQNPEDLSHIRQITPHISETILRHMPSIPTQHALIFGHAVNLPTTFKVNEAKPKPQSDNNQISANWFKPKDYIVYKIE